MRKKPAFELQLETVMIFCIALLFLISVLRGNQVVNLEKRVIELEVAIQESK
jgi:hypothetical protein